MPITPAQFLSLLQTSAKIQTPSHDVKRVHAQIIKAGCRLCMPLPNVLIHAYSKSHLLKDALQLFDEMPQRDAVSWDAILNAHTRSGRPDIALNIFPDMVSLDRIHPDHFIYATLLKACSSSNSLKQGMQVHANFVSSPFSSDEVVKSALVDMYSRCGLAGVARRIFDSIAVKNSVCWTAMVAGYCRNGHVNDALELFRQMPTRDLISWTALISGFMQNGDGTDALKLFSGMWRAGMGIDHFILSCVVGASANLSALELGRQFHGLIARIGYESSMVVSNALVDMYGKCSDVAAARQVFDRIPKRDVVSWTTMIVASAQHGLAKDALSLFEDMASSLVKPNEVTFIGLLYACSHSGLVEEGRYIFDSMSQQHGLKPTLPHYTCLVDLLGRAGLLVEAEELLRAMPIEPDEAIWAALLSACMIHGNTQMGIRVANHLLGLKPNDPSIYVLLSNTYASADMWDYVSDVRKTMHVMEVKKQPGYSWVELGKENHIFYAGDLSHPNKDEILVLLKELGLEMKKRGYIPDTSCVLHDVEQGEKEQQLYLHSERLAVAYGLLKGIAGIPIRVVKNLRVCVDCHTVLKLICSITDREIIVRDANRFHCFKDGKCSCSDFW